jgi:hypothetical protein
VKKNARDRQFDRVAIGQPANLARIPSCDMGLRATFADACIYSNVAFRLEHFLLLRDPRSFKRRLARRQILTIDAL